MPAARADGQISDGSVSRPQHGAAEQGPAENKIKLNGKKQPLSTRVQNGDSIRLFLTDEQLENRPTPAAVFVYEDDDIIIANKPAGIAVDGPDSDTLVRRVQAKLAAEGKPTHAVLCHRLDTGTSGMSVMIRLQIGFAAGSGAKNVPSISINGYGYISFLVMLTGGDQYLRVSAGGGAYLLVKIFFAKWKFTIWNSGGIPLYRFARKIRTRPDVRTLADVFAGGDGNLQRRRP